MIFAGPATGGLLAGFGAKPSGADYSGAMASPPSTDMSNITGGMRGLSGQFPRGIMGTPPVPAPPPPNPSGPARPPFDYDAALKQMLPEQKKPSTIKRIASVLGPALLAASGNQAGANAFMQRIAQQRMDADEHRRKVMLELAKMQHGDWSRQNVADLRASAPFTSGRDRVVYNPVTGQSNVVYDGPEDFETYAGKLGYEPGTDAYFKAVEDYVLKGSGPSAHDRDIELDDHRVGNDIRMEGVRQTNREHMEGLRTSNRKTIRQLPTYRDANGPPPRSTRAPARPTASGPNGQKVEWDGKAWVPVR